MWLILATSAIVVAIPILADYISSKWERSHVTKRDDFDPTSAIGSIFRHNSTSKTPRKHKKCKRS